MKVEIKIPALGESVAEATVSTLLKPTGSFVKRDEEILELETDKVNQVLYAPQSGTLHLSVAANETVKIGQIIGYVETDAQAPQEVAKEEAPVKKETPAPSPISSKENARVLMPEFAASLQQPVKAPVTAPAKPTDMKTSRKKMSTLRKVI